MKRSRFVAVLVLSLVIFIVTIAQASSIQSWYQGFEADTTGWFDDDDYADYGYINRVPSGSGGITSATGSYHSQVTTAGSGFNLTYGPCVTQLCWAGPFSRFAGYADEWQGTWTAEIDVYLDTSWPVGTGFDYSVAANGSDNNHQRDYIFHVTMDTSTSKLLVSGSNNTNSAPREDLETLPNYYEVTTAGWYTLQHVFYDAGGYLSVDLNLLDADGNLLFTETRSNIVDTIPGEVGGNRYAWFTALSEDIVLAVDEHRLDVVIPDAEAPLTTDVLANPVPVGSQVTITAIVDDAATGSSNIANAEYSFVNGPWTSMTAADGSFDSPTEAVTANFTAPTETGTYDVCVRGTDVAGNTGVETCTILAVYDPSGGFVTGGGWIWSPAGQEATAFNTIPAPLPGSFPSLGYEATSTDEAGDHITLANVGGQLTSVVVSLTDWACENDFDDVSGTWVPNRNGYAGDACISTPGSGFDHAITLNLYTVDNSGPEPAVGSLIATKTDTFFIPFRPSWDDQNCTASGQTPATNMPFGGKWFDPVLGVCVSGYAFTIEFDFATEGIILPAELIYGVAYDTGHHGNTPLNANGPYNSLNLSLTTNAAAIGTNVEPEDMFWDTSHAPFYCDSGAGGTDTFRRDWDATGCWGGYTPVAQFNTMSEGAYKLDPNLEGRANFGFVSKYKKGATVPTGNTEFQFQVANFNFHSDTYQWLVINQGGTNAQFKGTGLINGQNAPNGNAYHFMIWATDGNPDTFRIKIWWEDNGSEVVVYDNGSNQPIGGGSIKVHKN